MDRINNVALCLLRTRCLEKDPEESPLIVGVPEEDVLGLEEGGVMKWLTAIMEMMKDVANEEARLVEFKGSNPDHDAIKIAMHTGNHFTIALFYHRNFFPESEVMQIVDRMHDIICFSFGLTEKSLKDIHSQQKIKLQSVLLLVLEAFLEEKLNTSCTSSRMYTMKVPILTLKDEEVPILNFNRESYKQVLAKLKVDSRLSESEIATSSIEQRGLFPTRLLDMKEGCILFGNYVVSSHLQPQVLLQLYHYLRINGFLNRQNDDPQRISLDDVFIPTKIQSQKKTSDTTETSYKRCILMIVGRGSYLLCLLLRSLHYDDEDGITDVNTNNDDTFNYIKDSLEIDVAIKAVEELRADSDLTQYLWDMVYGYTSVVDKESDENGKREELFHVPEDCGIVFTDSKAHSLTHVCGSTLSSDRDLDNIPSTVLMKIRSIRGLVSSYKSNNEFIDLISRLQSLRDLSFDHETNTYNYEDKYNVLSGHEKNETQSSDFLDNILDMTLEELSRVSRKKNRSSFDSSVKLLKDHSFVSKVEAHDKENIHNNANDDKIFDCLDLELSVTFLEESDGQNDSKWRVTARSTESTKEEGIIYHKDGEYLSRKKEENVSYNAYDVLFEAGHLS